MTGTGQHAVPEGLHLLGSDVEKWLVHPLEVGDDLVVGEVGEETADYAFMDGLVGPAASQGVVQFAIVRNGDGSWCSHLLLFGKCFVFF